jgi:predicted permease
MPLALAAWTHDLRAALRTLRRAPGFSAVVVVSLALGIGANTALFSLLNAILLKSLPVGAPDRLVQLTVPPQEGEPISMSWTNPVWERLRDGAHGLDGLLAVGNRRMNLATGGEARFVRGALVSGSFFETLQVRAHAGRLLNPQDDRRGCPGGPGAVLSHGFWQREFGGAREALGRPLRLDGQAFTMVGVAPPGFFGVDVGSDVDVYVPLCAEALMRGPDSLLDHRQAWWLNVIGRLPEGGSRQQAEAALRALQPAVRAATMPERGSPRALEQYLSDPFTLVPAGAGLSHLRERYRDGLLALMAVAGLVLLAACANLANLMLARGVARGRELAVRTALGAPRAWLVRQLLLESALLGLAGAAAGLLVARGAARLLVSQLSTSRNAVFLDLAPDPRVLAFATVAGLLASLLFGTLPALRATGHAPVDALRDASRGTAHASRSGAARFLVAAQVGLSCVIVSGSALFLRSYTHLAGLDPGFDREGVLVVGLDSSRTGVAPEARAALYERTLAALLAVPGVVAAAQSTVVPVSGSTWRYSVRVPGQEPQASGDDGAFYNFVTPGYFGTLGTRLLRGRDFAATDAVGTERVAIVNETLARRFFPGQDPIGQHFETEERGEWRPVRIVGLVEDARYQNLRDAAPPTAYAPLAQFEWPMAYMNVSLRTAGEPLALREALVAAAGRVDPGLSLTLRPFARLVDDSLVQERLVAAVSTLFGGLGLLVAAVGLGALVSYAVQSRRGELGVRAALGASPGALVRLVLRDALALVALGLAAGGLASAWASRFAASLLHGVAAGDPATLGGAMALLAAVALAAGAWPAREAARVDPLECLRAE